MTAPQQQGESSPASSAPRPRVGQLVTYRHPDPFGHGDLTGHGVVLVVPADADAAVTVAPLSDHHLLVLPDRIGAVKPGDVPTSIAQPESVEG